MKKKKSIGKDIFTICVYVIVVIALALAGSFLFLKNYYSMCYVDGQSMYPTFNKKKDGKCDLGLFDKHGYVVSSLKRFDIITTYYASDYDSNTHKLLDNVSPKIKRLLAFPNEKIKIVVEGNAYVTYLQEVGSTEYKKIDLPYVACYDPEQPLQTFPSYEITLGENEYAVKGDNWSKTSNWASWDSFTGAKQIKRDYIIGRYVALIGTCDEGGGNPHYHFPEFYHV